MDIDGDLIWGNDDESEVFAEARSDDLCLIFRYSLNPKRPESIPSRIVRCFHDLCAKGPSETFSDRASMREELYSSIRRVWKQCAAYPSVTAPDVTVEIYEDSTGQSQWRICHESSYLQYVGLLLPIDSLFQGGQPQPQAYKTIDYSSLVHISHLEGRGRTTVVRISSDPQTLFVFKGVDFGTFLESRADFKHRKDVCYQEIRTICSLPKHPNIISPPNTFVIARKVNDNEEAYVCGTLYPFMEHGTLEDEVQHAKATRTRLGLVDKATWCYQMASAISHTHFKARSYHMDIKPANFLLNARKDLLLIDWEQSGAPSYTLAPEADGSWDVGVTESGSSDQETTNSMAPSLVYEKYLGPHRENLAWGHPKWNVFPDWRENYPKALQAAEVFSLGRTMWMVLEQVAQSEVEDLDEVIMSWSEAANDIPDDWKAIVRRCVDSNPNKRVGLSELVNFWEARKSQHGECSISGPKDATGVS